jgi:hypothetical protein
MSNVLIFGLDENNNNRAIKCDTNGILNIDLSPLNNSLNEIQKQEQVNINSFDFDLFKDILVPQLPIPPTNEYIKDPFLRNGWFLKNLVSGGNTQLYFFSSDDNFGYRANSIITLGQVENNGIYVAMYIDNVVSNQYLIVGIYTKPQNDGQDAVPTFYRSRISYSVSPSAKLYAGELVVLYTNPAILPHISAILPNARRVPMSVSQSVGLANPLEEIRFLSINHNSDAPQNSIEWCLTNSGFSNGETTRHFKFSVNTGTTEQSVSDVQTHTELSNTNLKLETTNQNLINANITLDNIRDEIENTNDKLDVIHDDIKDTEDLIRDVKEVLQDIEINTGATTDKISQLNVFNKSLLVQQVQNNKIHYMMSSRSGGGDTGGALIVQDERTTAHILPLLTAQKFIVQSSNDVNNFVGNLGLYRVKIEGVGDDGNLDSELIDVNGVNEVQSSKNYFHINKLEAILGNLSSGQVFVKRQDGIKYCQLSDVGLVLGNGFFMMPSNYEGYIQSMFGNDLTQTNMFIIKYNALSHTRNPIYRFFNRSNVSLIFEAGLGLKLEPREAIYLWNATEVSTDTTHYNFKIEMVPLSQTV